MYIAIKPQSLQDVLVVKLAHESQKRFHKSMKEKEVCESLLNIISGIELLKAGRA